MEITSVWRLFAQIHLIPHPSISSDSCQPPCDLPSRWESIGSNSRFWQKSYKHKTHTASHVYASVDKERVTRRSGLVQLNGADEVSAIASTSQHPLLFSILKKRYAETRKDSPKVAIQIWADFDLYHRNDQQSADDYANKPDGIPDFLFSYHNFEDFFALHSDGDTFQKWLEFGNMGHFTKPLHSADYLPKIKIIFPDYAKGNLPADFITWDSLNNLKRNSSRQPRSNPSNLQGLGRFVDFLIAEIERSYPGSLEQAPAKPAQP